MVTPRYDLAQIKRSIQLMCAPRHIYEVRAFPKGTTSGYFDDFEHMAIAIANLSGRGPAVYLTKNPVLPALIARANNRLKAFAREATADNQVVRRLRLGIDLDAQRPTGISSSDAEHRAALERTLEVREWLAGYGWPEALLADSGNGGHLVYAIDLPNDVAATKLLMNCLQALSFRFDDEGTKVDTGNFNAARVWKCYGSLCCKGDNVPDRPHRLARILESPERLEPVPLPMLQALAAQTPQPPPAQNHRQYRAGDKPFDLERWLTEHDIPILYQGAWNGGDKWVLARCLWNPEHSDKSAFILRFPNGAIAAGCHHNQCQGRGWAELREAAEPGYRDHRASKSGAYKRDGRVYIPKVEAS